MILGDFVCFNFSMFKLSIMRKAVESVDLFLTFLT